MNLLNLHCGRYHKRKFDVVVANQTIGELCSDAERTNIAKELWDLVSDNGVLIISERGSRYVVILEGAGWLLHSACCSRQCAEIVPPHVTG